MEKVLVASPIFYRMKYCLEEFLSNLRKLTYKNYDILIIDNSKGPEGEKFFNELKQEKGIILLKDDSKDDKNINRLVSSRNNIIDYALKNSYDHILMLDSDVIPPLDIIEKLLGTGKDVVSGIYYNYFNVGKELRPMPVAWMFLTEEEFDIIKKQGVPDMVKSRSDLRRHMTNEEAFSGQTFEVMYPSGGCMLIGRKVFSLQKYGLKDVDSKYVSGEDIYFVDEARKKGFPSFVNTSVRCNHLVMQKFEKDKEGNLLHPLWTDK